MFKFSPKKNSKLSQLLSKKLSKRNLSSKKVDTNTTLNYTEMVQNFESKIKKN